MLNDIEYWTRYYAEQDSSYQTPSIWRARFRSSFVDFIDGYHWELIRGASVVDICCGNGVDTHILARRADSVVGVDAAISPITCKDNVGFVRDSIENYTSDNECPDVLYSRFGLHAIMPEEQQLLFEWCSDLFIAEMRSDRDVYYPDQTHKRRLINTVELIRQLDDNNFQVLYFSEDRGYAVKGGEDPYIIRVVARRLS